MCPSNHSGPLPGRRSARTDPRTRLSLGPAFGPVPGPVPWPIPGRPRDRPPGRSPAQTRDGRDPRWQRTGIVRGWAGGAAFGPESSDLGAWICAPSALALATRARREAAGASGSASPTSTPLCFNYLRRAPKLWRAVLRTGFQARGPCARRQDRRAARRLAATKAIAQANYRCHSIWSVIPLHGASTEGKGIFRVWRKSWRRRCTR